MILVIGESNDVTCNIVCEYLDSLGANFKRINEDDFTSLASFSLGSQEKTEITLDEHLDLDKIKIIWHRRGTIRLMPQKLRKTPLNLYQYLKKEEESILKSIEQNLKRNAKYIGSYFDEVENYKIEYLELAKSVGFKIPETLITSSKKTLKSFLEEAGNIICKDIRYPIQISDDNTNWSSGGTFLVTNEILNKMEANFFPSLFQENILKEYEVRIFFFCDKLYPMAIFSQLDEKTALDFRNYNHEKPNRNVPVILPFEIEKATRDFISESNLSTGSIDLIVSTKLEYYFLEVNPQGQLDWLSKNCNYYIEEDIAHYLHNYAVTIET